METQLRRRWEFEAHTPMKTVFSSLSSPLTIAFASAAGNRSGNPR